MHPRKPKPQKTAKYFPVKFNIETLEKVASDVAKGKYGDLPNGKLSIGDEMQEGLRAIILKDGTISYHVGYRIEGSRPYIKVGTHPYMSINDARQLAKTIRHLASVGIDVQDGLHKRLIAELQREGIKWRPK